MCSCVGVFLMVEYDDNQDATVLMCVCVFLCVCVLVVQYGDNLKAKAQMSVYLCVYL